MKSLAWVAALAAAWVGPAWAQVRTTAVVTRAPVTVAKVVASIADGTEWGQGGDACVGRSHLRWNIGEGAVDVSRLAQPVRDELRHQGVQVAADPDDPFGARFTSDLMLGATITGLSAKVCGVDEVTGQLEANVLWQIYSISQKKVVDAVQTRVTESTRDKPVPLIRLVDGVMGASARQLLLNGSFEATLVAAGGGVAAPGGLATPAKPTEQYGPAGAHGDVLPHPQMRLELGGRGAHGMKIDDAVESVVTILRPGSIGSAFLVSRDGYLLTAAHVVGSGAFVKVRWADGFETTGEVVRRDERRDVALVKTDAHGRRPLAMKPEAPRVGDPVYAIGAPSALQGTVTRGIVSADRALSGFSFIQSDAAVNPGNSGGPLLNEHGEAIGIADLSSRGAPGINFFVPIGDALMFLGVVER